VSLRALHTSTLRLPHVKDVCAISLTPEISGGRMSRNIGLVRAQQEVEQDHMGDATQ
jgi:hypothetical protein